MGRVVEIYATEASQKVQYLVPTRTCTSSAALYDAAITG